MNQVEVADGEYDATVASISEEAVVFLIPECDPALLVTHTDALPHTEFSVREPLSVTITDQTITSISSSAQ